MPLPVVVRVLGLVLFATVLALPVTAGGFEVTRNDDPAPGGCDPGDCSLREAILAANANGNAGVDVIDLVAAGPYRITLGELLVTSSTTIAPTGPRVLLDGDDLGAGALFNLSPGQDDVTFILENLEIANGDQGTGGRAIHATQGSLEVDDVVFRGNRTSTEGGAMRLFGLTDVLIVNSVLTDNEASAGGGIFVLSDDQTSVTILDTHFVGNQANEDGAGLLVDGSVRVTGERLTFESNAASLRGGAIFTINSSLTTFGLPNVWLFNSTIFGNSANSGGGIYLQESGGIYLHHVTIEGNTATDGSDGVFMDGPVARGTLTEPFLAMDNSLFADPCGFTGSVTIGHFLGGNVESPGDTCGLTTLPGNTVNVPTADLQLSTALGKNGGATDTLEITSDASVLLGAGADFTGFGFPNADQRRVSRLPSAPDVGAFERPLHCEAPGVTIPDNDLLGVQRTLTLTQPDSVADLDLYIEVDHDWVGDLFISLTHVATNTTVVVRQGQETCSGDDFDIFVDDDAPLDLDVTNCQNADPAFPAPRYRPVESVVNLWESFDNLPIAGDWRLQVSDQFGGITGALVEWCLVPTSGIFVDGFESGNLSAWN